jgi:transposase-like protein
MIGKKNASKRKHQEKIVRALNGDESGREHGLRIEETYVRVKGQGRYLYRALDSTGATIDFFLSAKRDAAAARRFLAQAMAETNPSHPAGRQHRQTCRLGARHRKAQS